MSDDTYNGWKNYETWAVGMFLDGNYTGAGDYYHAVETVRATIEETDHPTTDVGTVEQSRRFAVADALKELVEQLTDPCGYGDDDATELHPLVSDMFGAALSSVDWYELADAWIENVREQVA
jgi:hypothetical protein